MYEQLKGKKLLVIGSDSSNISIIDTARSMGVYTIAVDGITDYSRAPAKKVADEAWDIDYSDVSAVTEKCRASGVDGVFAGYSEFRVLAACRIANALGLPFYANEDQINLTRNKRSFKDECEKYGIPIPKDYCFSYPMTDAQKDAIEYPVIVKPADYAGRKGITICNDRETLDTAVEYAASKSQSKSVIVETYLEGVEFSSVYTVSDGCFSLSCMNEKYITDDQKRKTGLCEFLISPSRFYNRYLSELDANIRAFMKGIGIRNGVAFFQGIVTETKIYVFEMGYRINGNNDFHVIEKFNGINFMKMMIAYSLCGNMCDDLSRDNPLYGEFACSLLFYAHGGTLAKFECPDFKERSNITDVALSAWVGKQIPEDGSTEQKLVRLKLIGKTLEEVVETVRYVQDRVVAEDADGNNLLFKHFRAEQLLD